MGLVDDILQGLPVNSILREKVNQLSAEKAAADEQNAILKDDLSEAKAEIAKLKQQVRELSHIDDLNETDLNILVCVSKMDRDHAAATVMQVNFFQDMSLERVKYHLARLEEFGYIRGGVIGRLGTLYFVTQPGRKLLLEKNLL